MKHTTYETGQTVIDLFNIKCICYMKLNI